MLRVTILYEDSMGTNIKEFGPHNLVVQCVGDKLHRDFWSLRKHLIPEPKNGVDKLLSALRRNMDDYAARDGWVFALIDDDDVREHLKLAGVACREVIVKEIKQCPSPHRLDVVLLERNLEAILATLRSIDPSLAAEDVWARAIKNKKPAMRDIILNRVAMDPAHTPLRAELLQRLPSLDRLISRVAKLLP